MTVGEYYASLPVGTRFKRTYDRRMRTLDEIRTEDNQKMSIGGWKVFDQVVIRTVKKGEVIPEHPGYYYDTDGVVYARPECAIAEGCSPNGFYGAQIIPPKEKRQAITTHPKIEKPNIPLPRIIAILDLVDHGPSDGGIGSTCCPHCGADGRYVYHFICEDGSARGAMKGCIKLFPRHRFCAHMERILQKELEIAEDNRTHRYGKTRELASWDKEIKHAVLAFANKEITEGEAQKTIDDAEYRRRIWLQRRRNQ